jgi:phosphomannomutase
MQAANEGQSASRMVADVNSRYANSGELNFKVEDKDAAIERALLVASRQFPEEISRTDIDGVRIEYKEGWINIRKSNTEPYLRLIVETDTKERLESWVKLLKGAIIGD